MNKLFFITLSMLLMCQVVSHAAGDKVTVDNGTLILPGNIEFIPGSDSIKKSSDGVIDAIALFMKENPDVKILRIEGYCTSRGDENSNMELSKLRAMSVAKAVISRGVECRRLLAAGFGSGLLSLYAEKQPDRITAVIAAGKFKKPGFMPVDGGGIVSGDTCR